MHILLFTFSWSNVYHHDYHFWESNSLYLIHGMIWHIHVSIICHDLNLFWYISTYCLLLWDLGSYWLNFYGQPIYSLAHLRLLVCYMLVFGFLCAHWFLFLTYDKKREEFLYVLGWYYCDNIWYILLCAIFCWILDKNVKRGESVK